MSAWAPSYFEHNERTTSRGKSMPLGDTLEFEDCTTQVREFDPRTAPPELRRLWEEHHRDR